MTFYQQNNILFALHGILFMVYLIGIYFMTKKINILESPNKSTLIASKNIGLYIFTIILACFELYYLIDFTDSKREMIYLYMSAIQQILFTIVIFLYVKNKKEST